MVPGSGQWEPPTAPRVGAMRGCGFSPIAVRQHLMVESPGGLDPGADAVRVWAGLISSVLDGSVVGRVTAYIDDA